MNQTPTMPLPIAVDVPVKLTAIIHAEAEGGYSASIPALPGCHTQGDTLEEVRAHLREAAEGWLAVAHEVAVAGLVTLGSRDLPGVGEHRCPTLWC